MRPGLRERTKTPQPVDDPRRRPRRRRLPLPVLIASGFLSDRRRSWWQRDLALSYFVLRPPGRRLAPPSPLDEAIVK